MRRLRVLLRTMPLRYPAGLLLVLMLLLPAAAEGVPSAGKDEKAPAAYRLRAGDEVALSVAPRKEYDCSGSILPDGMVYLRNVGGLRAAGLTLPELAEQVQKALEAKLVNPRVIATLARMAPIAEAPPPVGKITIVGAVRKTGPLDLEAGLRVRKALDLAGGTDATADLKQVAILHKDLTRTTVDLSTEERLSDQNHNRLLQDGDSIEVRQLPVTETDSKPEGSVRIGGAVANPGIFDLKRGMALEDLIVAAGKLTPMADVEHVQIQRADKPVQTVNLIEQQKLGLLGKVVLQRGDEVFIPELKDTVVVLGAISSPGRKPLASGLTIREFFLQGGSELATALNPTSVDLHKVQVIRNGQAPLTVNLEDALKSPSYKLNLALQSGDVLFIPPKAEKKQKKGPLEFLGQIGAITGLMGLF